MTDNKKTLAQKFIDKSLELAPQHEELQQIDPTIDSYSHIDEIMFSKGEYLGGMATIILALITSKNTLDQ